MKREARLWVSVGFGVLGLATVTALVVAGYRLRRQRELASEDPRTHQVRELIAEAEKLLAVGRRNAAIAKKQTGTLRVPKA